MRLKYDFPVISVIVYSPPGKNRESTRSLLIGLRLLSRGGWNAIVKFMSADVRFQVEKSCFYKLKVSV